MALVPAAPIEGGEENAIITDAGVGPYNSHVEQTAPYRSAAFKGHHDEHPHRHHHKHHHHHHGNLHYVGGYLSYYGLGRKPQWMIHMEELKQAEKDLQRRWQGKDPEVQEEEEQTGNFGQYLIHHAKMKIMNVRGQKGADDILDWRLDAYRHSRHHNWETGFLCRALSEDEYGHVNTRLHFAISLESWFDAGLRISGDADGLQLATGMGKVTHCMQLPHSYEGAGDGLGLSFIRHKRTGCRVWPIRLDIGDMSEVMETITVFHYTNSQGFRKFGPLIRGHRHVQPLELLAEIREDCERRTKELGCIFSSWEPETFDSPEAIIRSLFGRLPSHEETATNGSNLRACREVAIALRFPKGMLRNHKKIDGVSVVSMLKIRKTPLSDWLKSTVAQRQLLYLKSAEDFVLEREAKRREKRKQRKRDSKLSVGSFGFHPFGNRGGFSGTPGGESSRELKLELSGREDSDDEVDDGSAMGPSPSKQDRRVCFSPDDSEVSGGEDEDDSSGDSSEHESGAGEKSNASSSRKGSKRSSSQESLGSAQQSEAGSARHSSRHSSLRGEPKESGEAGGSQPHSEEGSPSKEDGAPGGEGGSPIKSDGSPTKGGEDVASEREDGSQGEPADAEPGAEARGAKKVKIAEPTDGGADEAGPWWSRCVLSPSACLNKCTPSKEI